MTNNDTPAERDAMLTSGRDILAENFDQIRLAFDSLKRDRDRLRDVIVSLRVNAIKGDEPDVLLAFMREGLSGVDAGLTIGEMITAYESGNHLPAKETQHGG